MVDKFHHTGVDSVGRISKEVTFKAVAKQVGIEDLPSFSNTGFLVMLEQV